MQRAIKISEKRQDLPNNVGSEGTTLEVAEKVVSGRPSPALAIGRDLLRLPVLKQTPS
jgi:hypothetical protein